MLNMVKLPDHFGLSWWGPRFGRPHISVYRHKIFGFDKLCGNTFRKSMMQLTHPDDTMTLQLENLSPRTTIVSVQLSINFYNVFNESNLKTFIVILMAIFSGHAECHVMSLFIFCIHNLPHDEVFGRCTIYTIIHFCCLIDLCETQGVRMIKQNTPNPISIVLKLTMNTAQKVFPSSEQWHFSSYL